MLVWNLGADLYTLPLSDALTALQRKQADPKAKIKLQPKKTPIPLMLPVAKPKGMLALKGLRIITMQGDLILPEGTILIDGERIHAIGKTEEIAIPKGTKILDLKGYTATPGFIDTHAHLHYNSLDIQPKESWEYHANLSYGVTTTHDPSASTELVFTQSERVRAGLMVGPRIFSTGFILYGAETGQKAVIRNLEEARQHIRRLKSLGAFSVKSYMQPSREQRQWVIQAAHENKMLVVPEGGGNLEMNLSMILDGHTGIEHALPVVPLYNDVTQLFARSASGYTPTLLVAYGGISGENRFYQEQPIWNDPRLKRFFPPRILDAIGRRRPVLVQDQQWHHNHVAASALKILNAGGIVTVGAHGQLQGLGYHWEIKALQQGGFSPLQALRAATLHGAQYIGLHHDLGSLQKDKLADILLFKHDPSHDLKHLDSLEYTIKHGFLYHAPTMRQIHPKQTPAPRFYHSPR
jgi:imidazolonepropionase-like amidohydrolase